MPDSKPSLVLPLVAAAIVGALVSFGVATFLQPTATTTAAPQDDARLEQVLQQVATLEKRLAASEQAAKDADNARDALAKELRAATTSNAKGLEGQGQTLARIEQGQTKTDASLQAVEASTKALNGRIEGNYTTLRAMDRRLKAVEGK